MTVTVVGKATNVVKTDSFAIDECVGNVATKDDRMSLARVFVSQPGQEPWLTLGYDEWIYCCSGRLVFGLPDGSTVELKAGETALIDKGTRFQPRFPEAGTSYIPVCIPAFRPDRCLREEGSSSDVAKRLAALHTNKVEDAPEVLYHMVLFPVSFVLGSRRRRHAHAIDAHRRRLFFTQCEQPRWEAAKASGEAYFPPTFDEEGFTHATGVPSRLIETANHFYQDSEAPWVCLRFSRSDLRKKCGITVRDERAMPVGSKAVGENWSDWICPHVVGGIPPSVVDAVFPMTRDGSKFMSIAGVTDV